MAHNQWSGIDPVVVAAQIIQRLANNSKQAAKPRQKHPLLLLVGKIHAGVRNNIMPEELVMDGYHQDTGHCHAQRCS